MSFAGHVQSMINSLKYNKSLRRNRKPFEETARYDSPHEKRKIRTRKPATEAEINELKERIAAKNPVTKRKIVLISAIVVVVVFYLVYRLLI